ncbi:MAG TPA: nitroreductase family deazaflavin-dependent oxidoreductase [Chloroflexota bacterium]|jgi:deazaflavin-dependent oxidoreductase (nitroreductase family)
MLFGKDHVDRYVATDGAEGHDWRNGVPVLILTTTGRRTGRQRSTPLIYGRDGDAYLVVASQGGAPTHPAWYRNLQDNPEVAVQVRADRFAARARTAHADEKARLWKTMTTVWPAYDDYQAKTDRPIPVVVLERV